MKRTISMILAIVMMLGMFCIGVSATGTQTVDLSGLTADTFKMEDGASIRIGSVAGIRFSTMIKEDVLDAIVTAAGGAENVEIGTIIAPTQYVNDAIEAGESFTMTGLKAWATEAGFAPEDAPYVQVVATVGTPLKTVTVEDTDYYVYAGSLENIKDANQTLAFSGIGYVKIGEDIVYASYNETNSRSVGYVAYRAYMDPDFDDNDNDLIDDFANAFLTATLGADAPDISTVRYFEGYNDMADTAEAVLAKDLLGLEDTVLYGTISKQAYALYGKNVMASYDEGVTVFTMTDGNAEGYTPQSGSYDFANASYTAVDGTVYPLLSAMTFLTLPEMNSQSMFSNGDTCSIEFTVTIKDSQASDDGFGASIGVSLYSNQEGYNVSRSRLISYSGLSDVLVTDNDKGFAWLSNIKGLLPQTNIMTAAGLEDDQGNPLTNLGNETMTVKFVFKQDLSSQQMYINDVLILDNVNPFFVTASDFGSGYNFALFFMHEGTIEIDNLLICSYNAAA